MLFLLCVQLMLLCVLHDCLPSFSWFWDSEIWTWMTGKVRRTTYPAMQIHPDLLVRTLPWEPENSHFLLCIFFKFLSFMTNFCNWQSACSFFFFYPLFQRSHVRLNEVIFGGRKAPLFRNFYVHFIRIIRCTIKCQELLFFPCFLLF